MNHAIDLHFRPKTYFGPQKVEQQLLSKVKGALLRDRLRGLIDQRRHDEVIDLLKDKRVSEDDREALEAIETRFMGGNYMPSSEEGEVDIARMRTFNIIGAVTSV